MSVAHEGNTTITAQANYDLGSGLYFKRAFSHAAIGLAIVDLDGNFIYTNPAFSKITGYKARELKKLKISALMFPEDAKINSVYRKKMLKGEIPGYVLEKRYIRKDGSLIWINSSVSVATDNIGKPTHIVGLTEDIDERHRAEEALKESEARFRFMTECMPPKIFTANAYGVINYLSPQWVQYTGIVFGSVNNIEWDQTIHPDDRESNNKAWQQAVATGEPFSFERRLRRADGTYRWHLSRANAMRNSDGAIIEWIGSDTDIEELRQSRGLQTRFHALAEQREQLINMNRLKDEFIMLASHQLRTPATGVKQYIGMLLQGYSDAITEDQREMLQHAYDSNERQIKIVDDLLRVARVDSGQVSLVKASCDIVRLIQAVVTEQNNVFYGRGQNVIFNPRQEELIATIDAKLMYVVIENLLDNASKYSSKGKTVTLNLRKDHQYAVVEVKDNGIGIRKKDQPQLFQKFSRIANPLSMSVGGTGLGLYWANKIVELHGGTIEVISKVRQGSTFSVRVPI